MYEFYDESIAPFMRQLKVSYATFHLRKCHILAKILCLIVRKEIFLPGMSTEYSISTGLYVISTYYFSMYIYLYLNS